MKKIISIFLILLLLFNALGFYGLFIGWRFKTVSELVSRLDNQLYSDQETFTIKVPISIPYALSGNEEFERVDGEIEYQGEFYHLVKQKLENDTLHIVCIKDQESKRINEALSDYVKTFTDKPADTKNSGKNFFNFIKDYLPTEISISHISSGWNYAIDFSSKYYDLLSFDHLVISPPPKA